MKREPILLVVVACMMTAANIASADIFGTGADEFTIDFVNISGATNPDDGYGIVNGDYRMGTYEITNEQWNKFTNIYGIPTGSPSNAYDESAYWTGTNVPTNELSWYEAAQFVNWLNIFAGYDEAYKFTGAWGTDDYALGVWESGEEGYDADNPFRNSDAYYFMPTEDEWFKAAYWNGTSIQTYATPDDSIPIEDVDSNYGWDDPSQPWDVGSGSEELNGTFDMMGNVWEWMESPRYSGDYSSGSDRGVRGGVYYYNEAILRSSHRSYDDPDSEFRTLGFRIASIPEPASLILLALGGLMLRKRRV